MYDKPKYKLESNYPCSKCNHRAGLHRFMYGVVTRGSKGETVYNDRYRCEGKDFAGNACRCGVEFTPKSFVIPERLKYLTESDEGRRQLIEMIDRGEVSGLEYKPK